MLNPVFLAVFGMGILVGIVLGAMGTRWVLQTTPCPRCGGDAAFDELRYRCMCGEVVIEEEI